MTGQQILKHDKYRKDIEEATCCKVDWNQLRDKTVLITGASGMIASCFIDLIMYRNQNYGQNTKIIAVSRNEERAKQRLQEYWNTPLFQYLSHDITKTLPELGKVDYLIHAASNTHPRAYAGDPIGTITTNVNGTYELLEYATSHECQRFLFVSSVEIYGENRNDVEHFEESYLGYLDCNTLRAGYPESKRLGETLCNAYAQSKDLDFVIGRFSRVYGPTMLEEDSKAIAQFIRKSVQGEDIVLKSEGTQVYSYTYVVDAAMAMIYLLIHAKKGEAYNISDCKSDIALKDLADILAKKTGTKVIFELPDELEKKGYSTATRATLNSKKMEALGWHAKTAIKEGLDKTVEILKK